MSREYSLHALTYNDDLTEGRGRSVVLAHFETPEDALKVAADPRFSRWCVMGVHSPTNAKYNVRSQTITVYNSAEEFWERHEVDTKRAAALAKLTPEDRKVLGLA